MSGWARNINYNFSLSKVNLNFKNHPIQIFADIIIGFYYLENRDQQENGSCEESHDGMTLASEPLKLNENPLPLFANFREKSYIINTIWCVKAC